MGAVIHTCAISNDTRTVLCAAVLAEGLELYNQEENKAQIDAAIVAAGGKFPVCVSFLELISTRWECLQATRLSSWQPPRLWP